MSKKPSKIEISDRKSKPRESVMTPAAFKAWRKHLGLSQKEAADALGLKRRAVQYYEKGERSGEPVPIPKTVRLACFALGQGCEDYPGPNSPDHADDDEED